MIDQLINNFYVKELFFSLVITLFGFSVINDMKNKDNKKIKEYFSIKNVNIIILLKYLLISFIIRILLEQLIIYMNISITDIQVPINTFELIIEFITTCIFAPLFEEIIFRLGLYKKLNKKLNIFISIIITSIIFALIHLYNIDGFIILCGISIIWNYAFYKTDNLVYPILLHFFHNLYALSDNLCNFSNYWYILLFINILCYIIIKIRKRQKS